MGFIGKTKIYWHKNFDEIIAEQMLRYFFIQKLYPVLNILAQLYFLVVNRIFELINLLKPRSKVSWTEEELANSLLFISAKKAAEKIRNKEITSEQLIRAYIDRIRRVQPQINAIVAECFEQALDEAKGVDQYLATLDEHSEEFGNLAEKKPLLGVPFSNKNNMDVRGMVTVAGYEPNLKNPPPEKDAPVIERLRQTGAILICLTNLPKLAMNWNCENQVYGRTNNPYDFRRIPGGSSGGEGALIAAGASIFGLGNDLGGSVRIPAFMCGIYGLKPTKDAVPLDGFVPPIETEISKAQWNIGPMCRYAEDLPLVFGIMTGKPHYEMEPHIDFSQIRVFYMDELNIWFSEKVHSQMRQALKKSVRYFETEFNIVAQKIDFPLAHHLYELWGSMGFGNPRKSVPELVKEFPKLLNGSSQMTNCAYAVSYLHAFVDTRNEQEKEFMIQKLNKLRHQIIHALCKNGILLLPTWPTIAPFHSLPKFTPFNLALCQLFNVLGFPSLACPIGLDSGTGVPVGVQIVGPPNSELMLMAAGKELEKGFGGWVRP